ncbi:g4147 [Coccomyxa viridis]|uniref:G4147 protein n=1 Tax=Coccomyxa viridis TaxID=1274662 RepID=A0ABP1FSU1_9CHLO
MPAANAVQRPKELVQIVDEDNKALGKATRAEMRAGNLIHRCSFAVVENSQGQLYVQKRVAFKETFPSHYDPAPGGVVGYGESYEDNAVRELEEEMGITGACLETLFDFWYSDNTCRLWGRLFRCKSDGPFTLDPEEVETGSFMSLQEVVQLLENGPVCPDSAIAVQRYLQEQHPELLQDS